MATVEAKPAAVTLAIPPTITRYSSADSEGGESPPGKLKRQASVDEATRKQQHGTLSVHLKRASNLIPQDSNGLSDPFVVVTVHGMKRFRTRIEKKTLNPQWDQTGEYKGSLTSFLKSPMMISLYDHDLFSLNDPLGYVSVDLSPLLLTNKIQLRQQKLDGVPHGTIDVTIRFEQGGVAFATPGPVAASAKIALDNAVLDVPSDASCIEHNRDLLLDFLVSSPIFVVLTVVWVLAVVGWVVFLLILFPMKMGIVDWDALGHTEEEAKMWWVRCNLALCSLFTWQNGLTFPWRASCAIHLIGSRLGGRKADAGMDFYGRPTEAMFFHIPTKHRAGIIGFLNGAVLLQFFQQIFRGIYTDYETSEGGPPGTPLIMTSFVGSIVCAIIGGIYQFRMLLHLHDTEPERFPPNAAIYAIQHFRARWKAGDRNCCTLGKSALAEFQERTAEEKSKVQSPAKKTSTAGEASTSVTRANLSKADGGGEDSLPEAWRTKDTGGRRPSQAIRSDSPPTVPVESVNSPRRASSIMSDKV